MREISPAQWETARRLLTRAGGDAGSAEERIAAVARVCDDACLQLTPIVGAASVQALFKRSLKLAHTPAASPAPSAGAPPRPSLQGLEPAAVTDQALHFLATLFGLLATLIGDELTSQVLRGGTETTPPPADPSERNV